MNELAIRDLAREIVSINSHNITGETISGFGMKQKVAAVVRLIRSAMFPNIYDNMVVKESALEKIVEKRLQEAAVLLDCIIAEVMVNQCHLQKRERTDCDKCRENARKITLHFMKQLPEIARLLNTDIEAAYCGEYGGCFKRGDTFVLPRF